VIRIAVSAVKTPEEWVAFAQRHGIEWEIGPSKPYDQHDNLYDTHIWPEDDDEKLLKRLQGSKYVIVRMFPHPTGKGLVRMRFTDYPEKPK
jgi:hypothetical protein